MQGTTGTSVGENSTRRAVLASMGAAGALTLAGCVGDDDDDDDDDEELADDDLTIGVAIPQDSGRTSEGQQLLDGYELASDHIDDGSGAITVEPWEDISEDGDVLGGELELLVEDTGGTATAATTAAESLVDQGADMLTGGASHEEGIAIQEVADDEGVIYMGGYVTADEVGGENCSQYAFHEMYNVEIAVESLAEEIIDELGAGSSITFTQLYTSDPYGESFASAFERRLEAVGGWFQPDSNEVSSGDTYESTIASELDAGRELIVLNLYGRDGARGVRDFANAIEANDDVDHDDVLAVVPILDPQTAADAGGALEDVLGTVHWLPGLGGPFSTAFEDEWDGSTGNPTQFAHLAYTQLCQYVAAVERAGSKEAGDVIAELEGREYDVGTGQQLLRECDHQAMRHAPVVRGVSEARRAPGNYYELVRAPDDGAVNPPYGCEEGPAFNCDL